jgi:hypothetical protein
VWLREGYGVLQIVLDIGGFASSYHYVHVFVEFRASCWFADRVADIICSVDVSKKDEFFLSPL